MHLEPPDQGLGLSIDGMRIPFTMQAEARHMSIEEAYAAGLFEPMPDEPGMIRMPISLEVFLPYEVLNPPAPPPGPPDAYGPDVVPPHSGSERPHTRFGNDPEAIAAQNIARSFQDMAAFSSREEKAAFRDLLAVMHGHGRATPRQAADDAAPAGDRLPAGVTPSGGPRADAGRRMPGGSPIRLVADEEEVRRGAGGRELSPIEGLRQEAYTGVTNQLRALEPRNPQLERLLPMDWVPDEAAVEGMQRELAAAEARAAPRSAPASQGASPSNPASVESDLGLPPLVKPYRSPGRLLDGLENGLPWSLPPSFREGERDGGPVKRVENSKKYPRNPDHARYQQQATGAPPGVEYEVPAPTKASGVKLFDGYDPATGNLIDAKRYLNWPTEKWPRSQDIVADEMRRDGQIAAHNGRRLEIRVATPEKAALLENIIEEAGISNVTIRFWPGK